MKAMANSMMKALSMAVLMLPLGALEAQEQLSCDVLLKDGSGATMTPYDNVAGIRYCEFLLTCVTADGPKTNVYFTTGLNNKKDPMDTCANFTEVDSDKVTADFGVAGTFMNGPRGWVANSFKVPTGKVRNFQGVDAVWESTLQASPAQLKTTPYTPAVVARDSQIVFAAGKPLFILNDPESGSSWVMKSWSEIVDSSLGYDNLSSLGKKLKLPEGWTFYVHVPKEDFTITAVNGNAHIIQDELLNTYDGCYVEDGMSSCSVQPETFVD